MSHHEHEHSNHGEGLMGLAEGFEGQLALREEFSKEIEGKESELAAALLERGKCLVCMDEGTAHLPMDSKLCLAGSGILMFSGLPREVRIQKVADLLVERGCTEITSHDGCGAAALAAAAEGWDGTPDDLGKKWAEDLQAAVNQRRGASGATGYRHIPAREMVRPASMHTATSVWLNTSRSRRFNPDKLENPPLGFVIDRGLANDSEYTGAEIEVAINIAFGTHGFGDLFTAERPFVINVIASSEVKATDVRQEIVQKILLKLDPEQRDRIAFNNLIVPSHKTRRIGSDRPEVGV